MFHATTESSSAIIHARQKTNVLIEKYGGRDNVPPMLPICNNDGPKHRSNFLSIEIAMIVLQQILDLDMQIPAKTAHGHSYINPPKKINCILNLCLNYIGWIRTAIYSNPGFQKGNFLIVLGLMM